MSPASNVRCFMDAAIRSSSFPSRSEKIGTRFRRSAAPVRHAEDYATLSK